MTHVILKSYVTVAEQAKETRENRMVAVENETANHMVVM